MMSDSDKFWVNYLVDSEIISIFADGIKDYCNRRTDYVGS